MTFHQFCRSCKHILTIEEMNKHVEDFLGLCNSCREKKKHAEGFKNRVIEAQQKEE